MKKEDARFIRNLDHWLVLARMFWRNFPIARWPVTLAIVSFTAAGCAVQPPASGHAAGGGSGPSMCTKDDINGNGIRVIYYFDRNDILYSTETQDSAPPNAAWNTFQPGGNIGSKDAWQLLESNKTTPFHEDPYSFHKHVSNWNTGSAVFAIMEEGKICPSYKCLFKAKGTESLKRDVLDNGYKKDCHERSCTAYKCGLYWCCK